MGNYRLGFLGAGKLAGSVIRGLLRAQFCSPAEILASEPNEALRQSLQSELGISVTSNNTEAAQNAGLLFL
jgi:pyrroline-5-carboxylate reductase